MKRIILVRSTKPESDSRLTKTASFLFDLGYDLLILGWNRNGDAKNKEEIRIGNRTIKTRLFGEVCPHGQGVKNTFRLLHFMKWVKKELKKEKDNVFAIHACDFDCGTPVRKFAKKYNVKYVYDIYDLFSLSRRMPKCLIPFINHKDKKIINNAFATIICTDERKAQISFAKPKRLFVIYNSPEIPNDLRNKNVFDSKVLKICYVGIFSNNRLLSEICDEVSKNQNIHLYIGGFGVLEEKISSFAKNFENITFMGAMQYQKVLELESNCDALFATYDPSVKAHKMSAPNKFYEAIGLNKPIIVCKDTGIDNLVTKYDVGEVCEYSGASFVKACNNLLNKDRYNLCVKNTNEAYPHYSFEKNKETIKTIYDLIEEN